MDNRWCFTVWCNQIYLSYCFPHVFTYTWWMIMSFFLFSNIRKFIEESAGGRLLWMSYYTTELLSISYTVYGNPNGFISLSLLFITTHHNSVWLVDWIVCCLLAGPDLWKRMPLKCSITMIFTCPLLSWCKISSPFRENSNVVVFPLPFHIFMPLTNMWFIRLQGHFPS